MHFVQKKKDGIYYCFEKNRWTSGYICIKLWYIYKQCVINREVILSLSKACGLLRTGILCPVPIPRKQVMILERVQRRFSAMLLWVL